MGYFGSYIKHKSTDISYNRNLSFKIISPEKTVPYHYLKFVVRGAESNPRPGPGVWFGERAAKSILSRPIWPHFVTSRAGHRAVSIYLCVRRHDKRLIYASACCSDAGSSGSLSRRSSRLGRRAAGGYWMRRSPVIIDHRSEEKWLRAQIRSLLSKTASRLSLGFHENLAIFIL